MARKPPALARELLRNFPKRRGRGRRRRRRGADGGSADVAVGVALEHSPNGAGPHDLEPARAVGGSADGTAEPREHEPAEPREHEPARPREQEPTEPRGQAGEQVRSAGESAHE
jgi:hypothetical protein